MPRVMERGSPEKRTRSGPKPPFISEISLGHIDDVEGEYRDRFKRKIDSTLEGDCSIHKNTGRYMLTEANGEKR